MIETWRQWTCNGCEETGNSALPNMSIAEVKTYLKKGGWLFFPGDLAYCPSCIKRGAAERKPNLFDSPD